MLGVLTVALWLAVHGAVRTLALSGIIGNMMLEECSNATLDSEDISSMKYSRIKCGWFGGVYIRR